MKQDSQLGSAHLTRRQLIASGVAAVGLGLSGAAVGQAYRFGVVEQRVGIVGLSAPIRVAFLSDLHYGPFVRSGSVRAWVDAAMATEPDVILLGGDLVDRFATSDVSGLLAELDRLRAPLGVYAVLGNHDHLRFRDAAAFRTLLAVVGVDVLHNRGVLVRDDVFVAGVDDLREGMPRIDDALDERPAGTAAFLMSHNPDLLPRVPTSVDLTLCGHTHGGQVLLPLIGSPITSSAFGSQFLQGWVRGPARAYVTRGLGFTTLPIRWNCPAELTVFDAVPGL